MTKLATSFARQPEHEGGPFHLMWTVLCWATAFAAVVVTTAILVK
jgi:hypothetical protein